MNKYLLITVLLSACTQKFENQAHDSNVVMGIIAFSLLVPVVAMFFVWIKMRKRAKREEAKCNK